MSAKTPIVSHMLARHIAEARAAGSDVDIERSVDQVRQLVRLAKDLEGHCEAMYKSLSYWTRHEDIGKVLSRQAYDAWKREQLGK